MVNTEKLRDEELIYEALCGGREYKSGFPMLKGTVGECRELLAGLADDTDLMNRAMDSTPQIEIPCYRKLLRPFIVLFRRIVRKFMLKWYVEPICARQTIFNTSSFKAMREMEKVAHSQTIIISELMEKNSALKSELQSERERMDALEKRLAAIESDKK